MNQFLFLMVVDIFVSVDINDTTFNDRIFRRFYA
jgi:hypothetical protein